ncbi:ABC transporter ATP-binding protein [Clostridium acetobutylicum]|uniref:ABC transporter ATP-binding protein n=1 Tax=Clostridium acetobutylicum (strain ATCC 824 / DSM 792 / JCM 1419 / IAM 19013 / LMG 5710 / NBRC 13948 / NRRL B-527 / VKM B-1787 / 2291 / W) TaxID=272562 RepID=Q97MD0_CLOAB|nr:ABC transporter ATP-binding protein [Clostridium acetobutylicum]AAK78249.1 ABC transporter ATP-binding protein [Clostridium acetobutylicum ATCC 824]AEI34613.1 ABC transporter ATP-binding protein [Clostridium acetobutylicum DSM 1731]PSM04221.1 ABC transporter ATP-binding protein [Clostridium sp. NJ4]AWV82056.1 ABC transporter ATP-binding protein [Clostridium acetobutylicum]TQD45623.1 ABC transporter ATP-binding protein [Clostridium acetobutylicum]
MLYYIYNKEIGGVIVIELLNVNKSYNGKNKAVDNLNFTINSGEIFGFLGPNGAGKSTTIKMITGIIKADSGEIKVDGLNIKENPIEAKRKIGYVPDSPDMFLRLKGIEYLNFMADIYDVTTSDRKERIESLSKYFDMESALDDKIQSYSHGMRQKIVVMGALIHDPDVWILDEPMTGLDPKASYNLKEMMRKHADSGKTVFFSTHVLEVAEKLCDRIGIVSKGKIVFCGTMNEMKQKLQEEGSSLERMFLELVEDGEK